MKIVTFPYLFRRFQNLDFFAVHLPSHDQRLSLFPAGSQPALNHSHVYPYLIRHSLIPPGSVRYVSSE